MKKEQADKIITEYLQKIYGFAMKKAYSYDEAEDICSDIVLEVYQSLLRSDEIANLEEEKITSQLIMFSDVLSE